MYHRNLLVEVRLVLNLTIGHSGLHSPLFDLEITSHPNFHYRTSISSSTLGHALIFSVLTVSVIATATLIPSTVIRLWYP